MSLIVKRIQRLDVCKSFQTLKRGEICRIPGCSVLPSAPGTPIPIRLPHLSPEVFKQFILYVYTGKVIFP
ncbi:BTB domain-containing protein [Sergentomyia squamirostris]